jgi:hypothetical protein
VSDGLGAADVPWAGAAIGLWSDASANDAAVLAADLGAFAADLPQVVHGLRTDWRATLRGAGLGWLFSHLQPVVAAEQALTGDADAVRRSAQAYRDVAGDVRDAGSVLSRDAVPRLAAWSGPAAEQARQRLGDFRPYTDGLAAECEQLAAVLDASAAMVDAAFGLVNSAATEVVMSLLGEWLAAQAAAPATAGASEAAFEALAVAQVTLLGAKTLVLTARVQSLLGRVEATCARSTQALADNALLPLQ